MIRESIRQRLEQNDYLKGVCVTDGQLNVFWTHQPDADRVPAVIFRIAGGDMSPVDACGQDAPHTARVEFLIVAHDPEAAVGVSQALINDLAGASWTLAETTVHHCSLVEHMEDDYYEDGEYALYACGFVADVRYSDGSDV